RRRGRADDVVPPLHDDARNAANRVDAAQQLILVREEPAIYEVMRFDPRERERKARVAELLGTRRIRQQRARCALPYRPRACRLEAHALVVAEQAAVISREQVVPLVRRNRREVLLPEVRKQQARAVLIEPAELESPQPEDAAQHELADGARVRLA